MDVILLERVSRLGQMGDVVRVKDGFARNFLLPRGKALRSTEENRTRFETMKSELQVRSQELKTEAAGVAVSTGGPGSRKLEINGRAQRSSSIEAMPSSR